MSKYQNYTKEELLELVEKQELELKAKKYGLVWDSEKEPEKVVIDCEENLPILKRVKDKEIRTDNGENNLLIEGDNYHALTCLNYTHKGKIDVIYIDPPYNTGNKDFIYNDRYIDREDGYRHSKWLNFMEKRLKLAKNLLTDKGVIFISIDDNEQAQLKLLCDWVFGEQNFISQIVWRKKYGIQNDAKFFSTSHEYLLCYAKNILETKINQLPRSEKHDSRYKNPDNDPRGVWKAGDLSAGRVTEKDIYEIITPSGRKVLPPNGSSWRYSQEKFKVLVEDNRIWFGKDGSNVPSVKRFLSDVQQGITPDTFWDYREVGHTDGSRKALKDIFEGHGVFDYPKPVDLIKRCLQLFSYKTSTILDFMAGSGTTGQAVLELNKEDGGNRKFILCTNNENQICEEVTYPRILNVIKGYKFKGKDKTTLFEQKITFSQLKNINSIVEDADKIIERNKSKFDEIEKKFDDNTIKITGIKNIDGWKDGLGGNLQYFKTDLVKVDSVDNVGDKERRELTYKAGQMIAIKENTFDEVETSDWYQIFVSGDKKRKTAIYFRENIDCFKELIEKIQGFDTELYIFSYEYKKDKDFAGLNLPNNVNTQSIPEPILELYKEINLLNVLYGKN